MKTKKGLNFLHYCFLGTFCKCLECCLTSLFLSTADRGKVFLVKEAGQQKH